MLRLKWGARGALSCLRFALVLAGRRGSARAKDAAASQKPALSRGPASPSAPARRQDRWTLRCDSTVRVDLPQACRPHPVRRSRRWVVPCFAFPQAECPSFPLPDTTAAGTRLPRSVSAEATARRGVTVREPCAHDWAIAPLQIRACGRSRPLGNGGKNTARAFRKRREFNRSNLVDDRSMRSSNPSIGEGRGHSKQLAPCCA
jgi:hypothetical protein